MSEKNVGKFIEDSKKLVGLEAVDVPEGWTEIDWPAIRRFTTALGDTNDLYYDPVYAIRTRYQTVIAPPVYLVGARTPSASGAFYKANYGLAAMQSSVEFEWFDVIRLGQRLRSTLKLSDAREGELKTPTGVKQTAILGCEASYNSIYEGLLGKARGEMTFVPYESGKEFFLDRGIYSYSDAELKRVTEAMDAVVNRPRTGMMPHYCAGVNVGDELPQLVKPPLTLNDMEQWNTAEGKNRDFAERVYQNLKEMKGRIVTNPTTKWPYWDVDASHEDIKSCEAGGYHAPYARGLHLICLASQLLTDWMGDDGFLRRLRVDLAVPNALLYGDALWIKGKVTDKYREKLGGVEYRAVDVSIEETNQLGETLGKGAATVYLPERGHTVKLPIPP